MLKAKSRENFHSQKKPNFNLLGALEFGGYEKWGFYCKRHILEWIHVVWAILREDRLRRLTSRDVPEKTQNLEWSRRNDMSPLTQGLRCRRPRGGTAAAASPPFRTGNSALCGSRRLVTPYDCRLEDLLCFVFMSAYCRPMFDLSVYYLFLQYFDTVGWVFWPVI